MGFPETAGEGSFFVVCNECLTFYGPSMFSFFKYGPVFLTILNSTGSFQGDTLQWRFAIIQVCMKFIAAVLSFVEKISV